MEHGERKYIPASVIVLLYIAIVFYIKVKVLAAHVQSGIMLSCVAVSTTIPMYIL